VDRVLEAVSSLGARGYRMIGFATASLAEDSWHSSRSVSMSGESRSESTDEALFTTETLLRRAVFACVMVFEDPIKPRVREAVAELHAAGVRVLLVSGDHQATCVAVGQRVSKALFACGAPRRSVLRTQVGVLPSSEEERQVSGSMGAHSCVDARLENMPLPALQPVRAFVREPAVLGVHCARIDCRKLCRFCARNARRQGGGAQGAAGAFAGDGAGWRAGGRASG
jgi:hypothetical protein